MKKYQIIVIGGPEYLIEAKGFEFDIGFYMFYDENKRIFLYTPINLTIIKPL
jgi:hypothetical protein